jgi:hypothetical protein
MIVSATGSVYAAASVSPTGDAGTFATRLYLLGVNGAVSSSFGVGASAFVAAGGSPAQPIGLGFASDGQLLVAASSGPAGAAAGGWTIARFSTAGSPDPLFGTYGKTLITTAGADARAAAVAVQSSGRIVVAGAAGGDVLLARHLVVPESFGSISGNIYTDANGNGVREVVEQPLSGKVYIDLNTNGVLDIDEPFATIDLTGRYKLSMPPGTYTARASYPAGYVPSQPATNVRTTTFTAGLTTLTTDWGAYTVGHVSGTLFHDLNANGSMGTGESPLAGRTVFADLDNDGDLDPGEPSTVTESTGAYSLAINPGTYKLRQVLPPGWGQTFPAAGAARTVTVQSLTNLINQHFGSHTLGNVALYALLDVNADGVQQVSDLPLSGRTVFLDSDGDGVPGAGERTAIINANGFA